MASRELDSRQREILAMIKVQRYQVRLGKAGMLRVADTNCTSAGHAARIAMAELAHDPRERVIAIYLNSANHVCGIETIAVGVLCGAMTSPREIFQGALLANAAGLILAHNHPSSGNPAPSLEDVALTRAAIEAGQLLGIQVHDHVIVGRAGFRSLREAGLF